MPLNQSSQNTISSYWQLVLVKLKQPKLSDFQVCHRYKEDVVPL